MAATLTTGERLQQLDRDVEALKDGFVEAVAELQQAPEVDESFEERWQAISDRLRGLSTELQPQDYDKEQLAELFKTLLGIRDLLDQGRDLDTLDHLLVSIERIRHVVRDALDEHVCGGARDVGLLAGDLERWLPGIPKRDVAELLAVDRRTLTRWADKVGTPTRRAQTVTRLVAILRHNWTPEGIIAWFHRPRRDLNGRRPLQVLSEKNFDEDALLSAARAGRSQYAS